MLQQTHRDRSWPCSRAKQGSQWHGMATSVTNPYRVVDCQFSEGFGFNTVAVTVAHMYMNYVNTHDVALQYVCMYVMDTLIHTHDVILPIRRPLPRLGLGGAARCVALLHLPWQNNLQIAHLLTQKFRFYMVSNMLNGAFLFLYGSKCFLAPTCWKQIQQVSGPSSIS